MRQAFVFFSFSRKLFTGIKFHVELLHVMTLSNVLVSLHVYNCTGGVLFSCEHSCCEWFQVCVCIQLL